MSPLFSLVIEHGPVSINFLRRARPKSVFCFPFPDMARFRGKLLIGGKFKGMKFKRAFDICSWRNNEETQLSMHRGGQCPM